MDEAVVVLVTAGSQAEADKVAKALLEVHVAACVNIVPGIQSHYWWQGELENAHEFLLIIKTQRSLVDRLTATVKAAHSYTVPEVIALPIVGGNPDYLTWLRNETAPEA